MTFLNSQNKLKLNQVWLFTALTFCVLYFYRISSFFPFYFIFDMDQITVLDAILIESNKLPDHYYHTSYGMYFTLVWINRILSFVGVSHIVTLDVLKNSLNPFNDIVFITNCFRAVTVATCTGIVFLLSLAFTKVFKFFYRYLPLIVFAFTLIPGLVWQAAMIKSEQYSVLYLLISFLLLEASLSIESKGPNRWLNFLILFSGISAGLALITKVQCLFLIILLVIRFFRSSEENYKNIYALLGNFFLFTVLITVSYLYKPNNSAAIGAIGYGLNIFSLFMIFLLLTPIAQQMRIPKSLEYLKLGSRYFTFFSLGIMLSFFTHFTLFTHTSVGLEYFLLDFKVVFLRILGNDVYLSPNQYLERLGWQLNLNPFAVILILFNFYLWVKTILSKKYDSLLFSSFLMIIMFLHLLMIVRNYNSDHLWFDIGLVFISIVHGSLIQNVFYGFSKKSDFFILTALIVGFIFNGLSQYSKKIDNLFGAVSQYGFNKRASLSAVYSANQPLFNELVSQKISTENQRLIYENSASRIQEFLPIAQGIFRSFEVLPSQIGPLSSDIDLKPIGHISVKGLNDLELQNGFIIKPHYENIRNQILWSKNNDIDQLRLIEKVEILKLSKTQFPIYTRRDIKVYMITDKEISSSEVNPTTPCQNFKLLINDKDYFCYELIRSQVLDLQMISPLFFYIKLN